VLIIPQLRHTAQTDSRKRRGEEGDPSKSTYRSKTEKKKERRQKKKDKKGLSVPVKRQA
jgi:hypothetical protein